MFIKSFAKVVIFMKICNNPEAYFINLLELKEVITVELYMHLYT